MSDGEEEAADGYADSDADEAEGVAAPALVLFAHGLVRMLNIVSACEFHLTRE